MLSQDALNYIADCLEYYIEAHRICVVIEGVSEKKYNDGIKQIQKAIKKLRKGKIKGVLKPSMIEVLGESIERDAANASMNR